MFSRLFQPFVFGPSLPEVLLIWSSLFCSHRDMASHVFHSFDNSSLLFSCDPSSCFLRLVPDRTRVENKAPPKFTTSDLPRTECLLSMSILTLLLDILLSASDTSFHFSPSSHLTCFYWHISSSRFFSSIIFCRYFCLFIRWTFCLPPFAIFPSLSCKRFCGLLFFPLSFSLYSFQIHL